MKFTIEYSGMIWSDIWVLKMELSCESLMKSKIASA